MQVACFKHEELYSRLRDELKKCVPGNKFSSIRDIMKRYEVSQLTVEKALSQLRTDGLLNNSAGRGLYISEQVSRFSVNQLPTYMLAVPQWKSIDIDELVVTVKIVAAEYPGRRLLVHKFDPSSALPQNLPLQEENVKGVIILTASANLSYEDMLQISNYSCPMIILGRHLETKNVIGVGSDDTFAGNLATDYVERHGHRHIGIFLSEPHNDIIMSRVKAICDYAELRSIKTEIIDCEVKCGEMATEKAYHRFSSVLKHGFDFTALVGISGESMQGAVNACHNHKVKIPDDLSMITIAAENLTGTYFPPLTTVSIDVENQIKTAIKLLDQKVNNPDMEIKAVYQRPFIIERKSVKYI